MPTQNSINSGTPQPINDLTTDNSPDRSADFGLFYDTSAAETKKILLERMAGIPFSAEMTVTDTGTQNNYAPTGLEAAYYVSWEGTSSAILTGLTGGATGRAIRIANNSTASILCLAVNNSGSLAANRFQFAVMGKLDHVLLFPGESIRLRYRNGSWTEEIPGMHRINPGCTSPRVLKSVPNTGTGSASLGIALTSMGGTLSTPAITASFRGQIPRSSGATGATAGTSSGVRGTQNLCLRGNAAGLGGFHLRIPFFFATLSATRSFLCGLRPSATLGNVESDTVLNSAGFFALASDTELRVGSNDGAGIATLTTLGTNFPINTTAVYESHLFALPSSSSIQYAIYRADDLSILPALGSLTTNLPVDTALLSPIVWINNRTTAADCVISWGDIELRLP